MKEPIKSKRVKISFFESPDPAKAIVALPAHPSFHHLGAIICRDNWSPMVFKEDSQNRRIRKSENFEFTDLLVFDVDEGLDIESAKGIILKYDLSALIATTRNHQIQKGKKAACDRFRIVLLLKSSIDEAKKYAELWMTASKVFGSVDQSCKDLARFYFKSKEIVFSHAGKCIDEVNPNSFPPILPQPSAGPKISEMSQGNPADLNDYFNSLSREEGSRNSTVMKFCRQAIATNTPEGKIQEYLLKYCNESGLELKEALVVYGKQKRTNAKKPFSIGKQEKDIGGIFFKCENPDLIKEWYSKHLGITCDAYGTSFEWRKSDQPEEKGYTAWSPFKADTKYFEPSTKDFMINYRVENLEALVDQLKKENVIVTYSIETVE